MILVLKEKFVCTMKKCMVSMATVKLILEHGGYRICIFMNINKNIEN